MVVQAWSKQDVTWRDREKLVWSLVQADEKLELHGCGGDGSDDDDDDDDDDGQRGLLLESIDCNCIDQSYNVVCVCVLIHIVFSLPAWIDPASSESLSADK